MKDKLVDVFKGHIVEINEDTFDVDCEDREGSRHFIEFFTNVIEEKYEERLKVGNWITFIVTEQTCKLNLARLRYWTQEEIDEAKKKAEELAELFEDLWE